MAWPRTPTPRPCRASRPATSCCASTSSTPPPRLWPASSTPSGANRARITPSSSNAPAPPRSSPSRSPTSSESERTVPRTICSHSRSLAALRAPPSAPRREVRLEGLRGEPAERAQRDALQIRLDGELLAEIDERRRQRQLLRIAEPQDRLATHDGVVVVLRTVQHECDRLRAPDARRRTH